MKYFKTIFLSAALLCCMSLTAFAYEIPPEAYYFDVNTREQGEVIIYVPYNYGRYFTWSEDTKKLINTNSSTVTCYGYDGVDWMSVRFPLFDTPQYRYSDSSYSWDDLTITELYETNVTFLNDTDFTAFTSQTLTNLTLILLAGVIIICLFMRR